MTGVNAQAIASLRFSDASLLRAAPVAAVLHCGSYVLGGQDCTAEYYDMSEDADHIDVFVSHNWCAPRAAKFAALALHFNMTAAWLVSSAAGLVTFAVLFAITDGSDDATCAQGHSWTSNHVTTIVAQGIGVAVFLLTLFLWQEVVRLTGMRGPGLFVDKLCVHQTDAELKKKGIANIAAFLSHSASMVVLYSDVYLEKLWTVYEIATFFLLFPQGRLYMLPLGLPSMVVSGVLVVALGRTAIETFHDIYRNSIEVHFCGRLHVEHAVGCHMRFYYILSSALALPLTITLSGICYRWAVQQLRILHKLKTFKIHNAQCYCESDRRLVENNIALFALHFGFLPPGTRKQEIMAWFDSHVHEFLPELLWANLGRTGLPYTTSLLFFLPFFFHSFDVAAVLLKRHGLCLFVFMRLLNAIVMVFCTGPNIIALLVKLPRCTLKAFEHRWPTWIIASVATLLCHFGFFGTLFFMHICVIRSEKESWWGGIYALVVLSNAGATFRIYRPPKVVHKEVHSPLATRLTTPIHEVWHRHQLWPRI